MYERDRLSLFLNDSQMCRDYRVDWFNEFIIILSIMYKV